ncbi:YoqO family protein [Bacillus sonorensis]|nr:YoqO family protein [Bacillus sonorensis]
MTFPSEDQPFLEIECSPSCWLFPYDPLSCLTEGISLLKKTGFCGLMVSIVLGICLRWRLNNSGILPDMLSIAGFVFALMYIWDEMKKESRKALLWKGTGVIIGTALLAFVIIKGRESIISLPFSAAGKRLPKPFIFYRFLFWQPSSSLT